MAKILIVDVLYWTPKGHSYVNQDIIRLLKQDGHEIHMYKLGDNKQNDILQDVHPDFMTQIYGYEVPKKEFEEYLDKHKIDYCIFNEYNQWFKDKVTYDKLDICKEKGIKTVGYLVWEKLDWDKLDHYKKYDKIICPTGFQTKLLRKKGLYNSIHTPWGVNFEEIEKIEPIGKEKKIKFYHCAGSGGVGNRKNTDRVIAAYNKIKDENTELVITNIYHKVFTREEILGLTKGSDVLINTSTHETIGINTLEANACGIPVIVCNAEPMNELVKPNINGFVVNGTEETSELVTCPMIRPDIDELASKMEMCKNEIILEALKNNSKIFAKTNFDWKTNGEKIKRLFK